MSELENILNPGSEPNEEVLKRYIDGTASDEERYLVELQMNELPFMNDAVEGLQQFKNAQSVQDLVSTLNKDLHRKTARKKRMFFKKQMDEQNNILVYVFLIIFLCMLGYFVIYVSLKPNHIRNGNEIKKTLSP